MPIPHTTPDGQAQGAAAGVFENNYRRTARSSNHTRNRACQVSTAKRLRYFPLSIQKQDLQMVPRAVLCHLSCKVSKVRPELLGN